MIKKILYNGCTTATRSMPIRRDLWRSTPLYAAVSAGFRTGFANQHTNLLDQVHQETGRLLWLGPPEPEGLQVVTYLSYRPSLRVCYSGGDGAGLPSASASASKIRSAGNSQGTLCGNSDMVGTSFGHLPEEISLLTSTATTASRSGW